MEEKQNWASFAKNMISEEDVRAMENDLRYRSKDIRSVLVSDSDRAEAVQTWKFGKQIGLQGKDEVMIENLQEIVGQVSSSNLMGKEILKDSF